MDFELSEEQSILKDSLSRLLADNYGFEQRKKYLASPEGWSGEMWTRYAEMGLMALPFAEEDGGIGGGPVETMIVMEALGGALALEPYFPTVVLGGGFLRLGGNDALLAELIEDARYAPYLERQAAEVEALRRNEAIALPLALDYAQMPGLSIEMTERLSAARPTTLAAAARIRGITPAALSAILLHVRKAAA